MPENSPGRKAIVVVDYDPAWPAIFQTIQSNLDALLTDLVHEICHIGSTAVPGLCAKPKIDVDVVLQNAAAITPGTKRMQSAGYACHGNKYNDGMWVFT